MYNPHHRLLAPLALKLIHLSAREPNSEPLSITWHSPSESDVFRSGDTILGTWVAEEPVVSPSFQLCLFANTSQMAFASEAAEDSELASCGTTVWPMVSSIADSYSISLSVPNITTPASLFFLQMTDNFGSFAWSPLFMLDPKAPASVSTTGTPLSPPSTASVSISSSSASAPSSPLPSSLSDTPQTHGGHLAGRKQNDDSLAVTWQSPSPSDVFGSGDTIIGKWTADKAVVSPSFQLCVSTGAAEDTESADNTACGATVWPTVTSSAGSYSISLSVPDITSASRYFLQMTDNFGSVVQSPAFTLDPNAPSTSASTAGSPSSDSASVPSSTAAVPSSSSPQPASPSDTSQPHNHNGTTPNAAPAVSQNSKPEISQNSEPDILASRQPPPVAAYAVPLSVVSAIILAAGIMSLKHRQKLKADRLRDTANLNAANLNVNPPHQASASVGSFKSAEEIEYALNVLARNELGYSEAPPAPVPVPLFMPVDQRWEPEPRRSTRRAYPPSSYSWDRESTYTTPNYARSLMSNHSRQMSDHSRQMSRHSRQPSNHSSNYYPSQQLPPSQLRPYLPPISTSNRAFFDEGDTGITEDVLSEYMVPSPILPPGMTVPPPRPPERLHVRVESPGRAPQGTSRRLTEYYQANPYGLVAGNLQLGRS